MPEPPPARTPQQQARRATLDVNAARQPVRRLVQCPCGQHFEVGGVPHTCPPVADR